MVLAQAVSDAGPVRKNNEDSWAVEDDLQLYVVADGMGGHSAGEVASRLAVEALVGFIRRSHEETDVSWPYGIDPTLSLQANRLRTAINLANRRVFRAAESHDDYTGMGTTVVAALITRDRLIVGSVGDSRLYLLNNGALVQLTQDDTWAATMLGVMQQAGDSGAIADRLVKAAIENGTRDNITALVVQYEAEA